MASSPPREASTGITRVLLVDDHPVVRQGLAQLINGESDMEVCGQAESASEALKAIKQDEPDAAVVDISLKDSNGIELIKDLKVRHPQLPVLVLSMHDESFYAERCLRAGARGYITKEEAIETVLTAIRRVLSGDLYLSENMASKMLSVFVSGGRSAAGSDVERLSDRELEVFELIGLGYQTREVAERLHLSVKTIDSHRANIKRKLGLANATELLQHAIQWVQCERNGNAG
jgi:DNA-binding NarL/FixJ family response regulator